MEVSKAKFVRVSKPHLKLSSELDEVYGDVDDRVAMHDHMLKEENPKHYYGVGASALSMIKTCISISESASPRTVLDFACGAGRVTRWLRAGFPDAEVTCADVRDEDLEFHRTVFGLEVWKSSGRFSTLASPKKYDLVWVGSLFTHLCEDDASCLFERLIEWLNPGGVLVLTFHGRRVLLGKSIRKARYISDEKFKRVRQAYEERGYGYEDYDGLVGLGFALTKPNWYLDKISRYSGYTVAGFFERAWDHHHDVIGVVRSDVCPAL